MRGGKLLRIIPIVEAGCIVQAIEPLGIGPMIEPMG